MDLPCKEKLSFKTRQEAEGAAATAKYRYGQRPKVYKCKHCENWHLARDYDETE